MKIPWFDLTFSGGMSMHHKIGALMGMSDMTLNIDRLHRAMEEGSHEHPLWSHWHLVPFGGAYGGNTASATARVSELTWRYITAPSGLEIPQIGGLSFFDPRIPIGFAGTKVVTDPDTQAIMRGQQKAQVWLDSFFATIVDRKKVEGANSVAEMVEVFRDSQRESRRLYLEKHGEAV